LTIQITDYLDVRERARALGLIEPEGLVFLPRNFDEAQTIEELVYEGSLPDVRLLLREAGFETTKLEPSGTKPKLVKENAFEWTLPTLFIGGAVALYRSNPDLIKSIVNKLWDHSKIVFAAVTRPTRIKWSIIIEDEPAKKTKKISYEGPAEGLEKVRDFLETTLAEGALDDEKEKEK
jgi:hypothetical protein